MLFLGYPGSSLPFLELHTAAFLVDTDQLHHSLYETACRDLYETIDLINVPLPS